MKRREFIRYGALASTSMMVPKFLKGFERPFGAMPGDAEYSVAGNRKVLVVVQLSGGNDGLNTIIPFKNDIYYKLRPQIGKKETESILKLNDELAFNPAMDKLKALYDDGRITIVNSVGYPNPDRSHFRSMDIWNTASDADQYLRSGWVGRYLDSNCPGSLNPYSAIETDSTLSLAMKGQTRNGIAVESPDAFYAIATEKYFKAISDHGSNDHQDDNLHYLYKTLAETNSSADYIYKTSKIYKTALEYPNGEFAKNLKTIATLINSGLDTTVYYISLGGFDTHDYQPARQDKLLKELSDGLSVFASDLKANNRLNDVTIITFSEFGRRVSQNASNGTDHGTANNMMIINGNLKKPGIYNEAPDLVNLDEGDLKYKIDFREVYADVLKNWLNADDQKILGKKYNSLGLV